MSAPPYDSASRSALIAGATGLVGGFLLQQLLQDSRYRQIHALVRRPMDSPQSAAADGKLRQWTIDFDQLAQGSEVGFETEGVDDVFCCLGTTIKTAGSEAAFRKVDHDYVVAVAAAGRRAGGRRLMLVSSVGADPSASSFYLQVKGETEASVADCGYGATHCLRPGPLAGPREEHRSAEKIGLFFMPMITPFLRGGLRKYRAVHARDVAKAMVGAAHRAAEGTHVYTHDDIMTLAAAS